MSDSAIKVVLVSPSRHRIEGGPIHATHQSGRYKEVVQFEFNSTLVLLDTDASDILMPLENTFKNVLYLSCFSLKSMGEHPRDSYLTKKI